MKKILIYLLSFLFLAELKAENSFNDVLKQKLKQEVGLLEKDLADLNTSVSNLKQDKLKVEKDLFDMHNWGLLQQKEKMLYYNQAKEAIANYTNVQELLNKRETEYVEAQVKYHKLKRNIAFLMGAVFFLAYLKFSDIINPLLSSLPEPWGWIIRFAAPLISFIIGSAISMIVF
jgi:hypothetical protein